MLQASPFGDMEANKVSVAFGEAPGYGFVSQVLCQFADLVLIGIRESVVEK